MELKTAREILEYHQEWRLGKREDMIHEPKKLTQALDIVLSEVKKFRLLGVGKSLRDFTDDDILDEIDADMNYWCVPQGEIESMRQDWRNKFLILRRER